jgi:hypothetical protein
MMGCTFANISQKIWLDCLLKRSRMEMMMASLPDTLRVSFDICELAESSSTG